MRPFQSSGAADTEALGAELAVQLRAGDVVLLCGELGSGKTTLVRGACRALGVEGPVTSPTFAIGNRYHGAGGVIVSHLDLYRATETDAELLADYLGAGEIAFVEWPGELGGALEAAGGPVHFRIRIEHAGGDARRIELRGP